MSDALQRFYKVFISSTFKDLAVHRQQAMLGILKAGHMPVALENFAPDTNPKREVISKALKTCQFYVIILGSRYGAIPEDQKQLPPELRGKSYTEIEMDIAEKANVPVLAFIMDSEEVDKCRLTSDWIKSCEPENIKKYEGLRKRLTEGINNVFYRLFTKPDEILTELYAYFCSKNDVPGYRLEPKSGDDVARDVVVALGKFSEVDPRFAIEPQKKEALAAAFCRIHGEDIIKPSFSWVFFESGSTITQLARRLSDRLPKRGKIPKCAVPVNVLTNNAFAYLYLWLCSSVMCHPVPEGPPDPTYGGMYGPLTGRDRSPDYHLPPLEDSDKDSSDLIKTLKNEIFPDLKKGKGSLLLAAASGLQLTDEVVIKESQRNESTGKDEWVLSTDKETRNIVKQCRGFHVGSYQNMLFKRCYYLSRIPTVVFIHDKKVDCEVKIGKCHFLSDQGTPWGSFVVDYPLSIWIACERNSYKPIIEKCQSHFRTGDWSFTVDGEFNPYPIVIGHNKAFRDACDIMNFRVLK